MQLLLMRVAEILLLQLVSRGKNKVILCWWLVSATQFASGKVVEQEIMPNLVDVLEG